jgi:hypothetical protein
LGSVELRVIASRTNPMVKRVLRIPGTYSVDELTAAICISMGISYDEKSIKGRLVMSEGRSAVSHDKTVSEVFDDSDRGEDGECIRADSAGDR